MQQAFIAGFLLSIGLIGAFGAQNTFVLRQSIKKDHIWPLVLFCSLNDLLFMGAAVWLVDSLSANFLSDTLASVMYVFASCFIIGYALLRLREVYKNAYHKPDLVNKQNDSSGLLRILLTGMLFSWLNPHVYFDALLIGVAAASYEMYKWYFYVGAVSASFLFFFSLAMLGGAIANKLSAQHLRIFDLVIAIAMLIVAAGMIGSIV